MGSPVGLPEEPPFGIPAAVPPSCRWALARVSARQLPSPLPPRTWTKRSRPTSPPSAPASETTSTWRKPFPPPTLRTPTAVVQGAAARSEEHTSELQSRQYLVCRLLLERTK